MMQSAALAAALSALMLFAYAVFSFWRATRGKGARRVRARLVALTTGVPQAAETSLIKDQRLARTAWMQRFIAAFPRTEHLKKLIAQAGISWTAETFFTATAVAFLIIFLVALILTWWPIAIACGAAASFLPLGYLCRQRNKRLALFEIQFPETLDLISRALRAGHAFGSGLKVAAEEGPEPLATEFRLATEEINLGLSAPQALLNLANRVPLEDVRFFVTAVLIQRETGGNLTEILGNISSLVRERLRLFANIRVLSAEGRLSAWILIALPIAAAGMISIMNPGYLKVLFVDPLGNRLIAGGLVSMVAGILWMRRIIRIRV
jgi:tight adherence protein B